jgi:hypothetical protein
VTSEEPSAFTALIAEYLTLLSPASPARAVLQAARDGHRRNQHRRAAVLRHDDLRRRLGQPPLSFHRPALWNGYVPPATISTGPSEGLRTMRLVRDGTTRFRYNQAGLHTAGETANDSPQRAALITISTEAWHRERGDDAPDVTPSGADQPDALPEAEQQSALPAPAAGPAGLHDAPGQLSSHDRTVTRSRRAREDTP